MTHHPVPDPIRGGTWLYCPWNDRTEDHRLVTYRFCGRRRRNWATGSRFRTMSQYRRHYRRHHGDE